MRKIRILFAIFIILIFSKDAISEMFMSISGKVSAEDTGLGVPGVSVMAFLNGSRDEFYTETDDQGQFFFKYLKTGIYSIGFNKDNCSYLFGTPHLSVNLSKGKNAVIEHILTLGGSVSGTIFDSDGVTPLKKVKVSAKAQTFQPEWIDGFKAQLTNDNGNFFLDGLPETDNCIVTIYIPGHAKLTKQVKISKGKITEKVNFIANWSDHTIITGIVKSSVTKAPIPNVRIFSIDTFNEISGTTMTNEFGNYSILNLTPGIYNIFAFLQDGGGGLFQSNIVVESDKTNNVNFEFDIQYLFNNSSKNSSGLSSPNFPFIEDCDMGANFDKFLLIMNGFNNLENTINNSDCISSTLRNYLKDKLDGGITIKCDSCESCGWAYLFFGSTIYLCPPAFDPNQCGCLQSTLLHELLHTIGFFHPFPYSCEKSCYSDCTKMDDKYKNVKPDCCKNWR